MPNWLLYGAYGYTGALIAEEALKRGHRPLLAGRNADKLATLAERSSLHFRTLDLNDRSALAAALADVDLVLHAAGPFVHTSRQMVQACLDASVHYLDITGEIQVIEKSFAYDEQARARNVVLMSGVGFDVVPTDCLAKYVADQMPTAVELEIAFATFGGVGPGTMKSALEGLPQGGVLRRQGRYVPHEIGTGARQVQFSDLKERTVLPVPWGDLATGFRTTGIPNITTYMAYPSRTIARLGWLAPVGRRLMSVGPVRRLAQSAITLTVKGPDEATRQRGRAYVWARATDEHGKSAQAWLETIEAYWLTAVASVRCVEKVLESRPVGALTPALAFGADFALELEGSRRHDTLPTGRAPQGADNGQGLPVDRREVD